MLKFNLAEHVKRPSRRPIVLRPIQPTKAQADSLATLYLRVVAVWSGAADLILAAYSKTLGELQQDSADDIKSVLEGVAAEVQRLVLQLSPDLRQWAFRVEQVHRGKWVGSILTASDVNLDTVLTAGDVNDTVAQALEWNVSLIRDVGDEARRRIANAVFAGIQQRKAATDVAKEIREAVGMARRRSINIAADQTVKLGARLNEARQQQAGLTHFKWRHSAKRHPRSWHLARDGKVYPWANSGIPADDMAGVPPWCGCTAQGVISFD